MTPAKPAPVKFLLVDDREENLIALEALLRRDGLEILIAHSGREALELLLVHDFALALVDVQMPEMDGFELAELMRGSERSRHVPIVFVTAGVQDQRRVFEGYTAGAVDFLFKPVDPGILKHKTETFFELYRQKQELAENLRMNETFVAAVGHDLRNPLNSILLSTELLRQVDDPEMRAVVDRVRSSSLRMSQMIDQLFDLARVRLGGGITLDVKAADFTALVEKVLAEHEPARGDRAIELVRPGRVDGAWDTGRIAQIVSNLVGNALRHGAKGTPVKVEVRASEANVTLVVENRGEIPGDVMDRLFDPFRAPRQSRTRKEGLGLGMYIVNQLVTAHGGTLDVRSENGVTRVEVTLPRRVDGEGDRLSG